MPTIKTTVPRITRKQLRKFEEAVPGLSTVAVIPVITKEKDALRVGARQAVKKLNGKEFITKDAATVKETPEGWEIEFKVYGSQQV